MAPNLLGRSTVLLAGATEIELPHKSHDHLQGQYQQHATVHSTPQQVAKSGYSRYKWDIVWRNVIAFIYLHVGAIYGMYLWLFVCRWPTLFFTVLIVYLSGFGVTAGAHRLWAHRSYKAKLPLRIILMVFQTLAFQNHIFEWVRDHRVHHKFTDTDADPHNAKRGFFFSHIGWLMLRKHRDVFTKGKTVHMDDVAADPVVAFQKKWYPALMPVICFVIPTVIPWYCWGENIYISWYVLGIFRYTLVLNGTWSVNSAAHIWGNRPYDKTMKPTENISVAILAVGEGWHNYHHVFPWDYKAAELGNYRLNFSTAFIDLFAKIGWAYDLKTVSEDMVRKRSERTGDGTRTETNACDDKIDDHHHNNDVWGWGDKDMTEEDIKAAKIYHKLD